MNILTVSGITKAYGERKLFDDTSFYLQEGEKTGIIGLNGAGKSTLLKMIAGEETPDQGEIIRANGCVVRYLPQNPVFSARDTVLEAVLQSGADGDDREALEVEAKTMLTRLGVSDFAQPCGELSGGQRKRLALVAVLLSAAEILVLDEPTNHLDSEMADWLEDTLRRRKGAIIMVTHDRYFLDSVSTRILELDGGKIYSYEANYSGYLELKMQREERLEASERKRRTILRSELAWVQRGARARSTKQKARLERYESLRKESGPAAKEQVAMTSAATRLGRTTVELAHISKAYGDKILIRDFTYIFDKADRVGFVGKNGSGKTTLMRILLGELAPDAGSVTIGSTVKIGYFAQELGGEEMDPGMRVIDYVREVAEYVDTPEGKITAARMLERFLFAGEDQYGLLGKLSGGERRRLYLLKVLMGAPNVLVLDEPTNDLDIATLRVLEDYLDDFAGIVIAVSHDRYFLDRTVRRIFSLEEDGALRQYEGGYTDYVNRRREENRSGAETCPGNGSRPGNDTAQQPGKSWKTGQKKKLRFTFQEQRDYDSVEGEIAELEDRIGKLDERIPEFARDFVKLSELTAQKEQLEKQLEEKMDRWMYLEELAARIAAGEMTEG